MAYLCYFTADVVWGTSGIIATLTLGLMINSFGRSMINDNHLLEDFWSIVEHLLNTVIFTLGGLVWGGTIANSDEDDPSLWFTAQDWGFLFVLYAFLTLIRFFLFSSFYPITSNLGLKSNWREAFFQSYAGLRGSIGIALALALNNTVQSATGAESDSAVETSKLFGLVGGIAFLTLTINATTCGPLLKLLGLTDATKFRKTLQSVVWSRVRTHTIDHMVRLLAEPWFEKTNFAVVRAHVPLVSDLKKSELKAAVKRFHNANHYRSNYRAPNIERFLPYLDDDNDNNNDDVETSANECDQDENRRFEQEVNDSTPVQPGGDGLRPKVHASRFQKDEGPLPIEEVRRLFYEILRTCYHYQIEAGYLNHRELLVYLLTESLDLAIDKLNERLTDWDYTQSMRVPVSHALRRLRHHKVVASSASCLLGSQSASELDHLDLRFSVERCLAFLDGHKDARRILQEELSNTEGQLSEAEEIVLKESEEESDRAKKLLESYKQKDVESIVSHKFCNILLNRSVKHIEKMTETNLLKETEAQSFMEDIQDELFANDSCRKQEHPGEMKTHEYNQLEMSDSDEGER